MISRERVIRKRIRQYEGELVAHLAHCGVPGQCAECEILLCMFAHWNVLLGSEIARIQQRRDSRSHGN